LLIPGQQQAAVHPKSAMVLAFYRRFLVNQAVAMGIVSEAGGSKRFHHIDHSDKTFWKSFWVGLSCALYWILAWQCLALVQHRRLYYGLVFVAVGICSVSADTGLFRHHQRLMRANQLCDRWTATTGTLLILSEILSEFAAGEVAAALVFVAVAGLAFCTLQKARERVHAVGHDWGWVLLHSMWHVVCVAGTVHHPAPPRPGHRAGACGGCCCFCSRDDATTVIAAVVGDGADHQRAEAGGWMMHHGWPRNTRLQILIIYYLFCTSQPW
jgi:hypothetical protein